MCFFQMVRFTVFGNHRIGLKNLIRIRFELLRIPYYWFQFSEKLLYIGLLMDVKDIWTLVLLTWHVIFECLIHT